MSAADLKATLNTIIAKTDDENLLNKIYQSILKVINSEKNTSVKLSTAEKKAVDEALDAIKNGEVFPHEKTMAEMKKKHASLYK
jgi:predicted transcriptional regulator